MRVLTPFVLQLCLLLQPASAFTSPHQIPSDSKDAQSLAQLVRQNLEKKALVAVPRQVASIAAILEVRRKPQEANVMTKDMQANGVVHMQRREEKGMAYFATVSRP